MGEDIGRVLTAVASYQSIGVIALLPEKATEGVTMRRRSWRS